jgi:hypothetical protein
MTYAYTLQLARKEERVIGFNSPGPMCRTIEEVRILRAHHKGNENRHLAGPGTNRTERSAYAAGRRAGA